MGRKKNKSLEHYYKKRGRFFPLFHDIFLSSAYRDLTPKARCLLHELQFVEFPNRNGRIGMSETKAAALLGVVPNTASKAFEELMGKGFIERMFDGDHTKGLAAEWRLTFLPYDGKEPSDDWKYFK
jgi:hypothetical protein